MNRAQSAIFSCQPVFQRQPPCLNSSQQGFTLLEMMLVILITASLSASGLYGWQRWQQQQQLTQAVRQTRQFLERLRDDANWHNRNHYLWLLQQEQGWCLGSVAQPEQLSLAQQCDPASPWQMNVSANDIRLNEQSTELTFYGLRNTAWAGHLTLQSPAGEWKIIVSDWGRIRSCSARSKAC